ncbi:MAG TPA: hypothetical protein DIS94_06695 [Bacteroidetes bacterium]|nr:hypothetical protein [Bacteroidota bacterium]
MSAELTRPKVFISYSWKPEEHKELVKDIADRLVQESGIDVMLDRYDLNPGDDKYAYMERMVTDKTISKVLIFSNQEYTNKANNREGGVGTESTIISQEVYQKVTQNKFIPILLEKNHNGEPCLPTFIKSRIHFDFSDAVKFEDEYEKLVRFLYNKPIDKKPELGAIPSFILENDPVRIKFHHRLERFKNAVLEGKKNTHVLVEEYLNGFIEDISQLRIEDDNREVPEDEKIYDMILKTKAFRDDFLEFFEWMIKLETKEYIEILHKHIESWSELVSLEERDSYDSKKVLRNSQHYKFLLKELFLYIITIALQKEKFEVVDYILNIPFWVKDHYGEEKSMDFTFLYNTIDSLDRERKSRMNSNRLSISTDLLIDEGRMDYKRINLNHLQETDRILHYVSYLHGDYSFWFPYLTMYRVKDLSLMKKAESKRFFEKIKCIFQINDIEELKSKINEIPESKRNYYDFIYKLVDINSGLNVSNLATKY